MKHPTAAVTIVVLGAILCGCQQAGTSSDQLQSADVDFIHSEPTPAPSHMLKGSQVMMRAKLAHAQAVLEGISLSDFDQIHQNARNLTLISQETDWHVHRTIEYNVFSTEFRQITDDLAEHAADKNIHAATLDYMQMVMICVKCHSHMRNEGLALIDNATPLTGSRASVIGANLAQTSENLLSSDARSIEPPVDR